MLSEKEKEELLKIARRTLESYLKDRSMPSFDSLSENLLTPQGAFVSLHKEDDLRGCIGRFESPDALFKTVQIMAIAAATEDPRFHSVMSEELSEIDIEISALSPRQQVASLDEIEVGKHGIQISKGINRGVLLPQVAVDQKWNREEFLTHTCIKAGLPPDAWTQEDIKIEIFSAEVFSEKK